MIEPNNSAYQLVEDDVTIKRFEKLGLPLTELSNHDKKLYENMSDELKEEYFQSAIKKTLGTKGQDHMFNGLRGESTVTLKLSDIMKVMCGVYTKIVKSGQENAIELDVPSDSEIQSATMLDVEDMEMPLMVPTIFINMTLSCIEDLSNNKQV